MRFKSVASVLFLCLLMDCARAAEDPVKDSEIPTAAKIADMLRQEPMTLATWPDWKPRLLSWIGDPGRRADAAFSAASEFIMAQPDPQGELLLPLADDSFAWYLLGRGYLNQVHMDKDQSDSQDEGLKTAAKAERALRKSISLDPDFARAHRNLALALMIQRAPLLMNSPENTEAAKELKIAQKLDPTLNVNIVPAQAALERGDMELAELLYAKVWDQTPDEPGVAEGLAMSILRNDKGKGPRSIRFQRVVTRYPQNGTFACLYAMILAKEGQMGAAAAELKLARGLGVDPKTILSPRVVDYIEGVAPPNGNPPPAGVVREEPHDFGLLLQALIGFVAVYAVVILSMAVAGVVLGRLTKGLGALQLLSEQNVAAVEHGQVVRAGGEPLLAKLYAASLVCGLVLFYIALPVVAIGLLATTLGALWLIFQARRIPVKLVLIIVVVGLSMTWAVLKSIFARMGTGTFGIEKTPGECPRLFAALNDVAQKVDTPPVDQVFLAPGSEIGVHQQGYGPFGVFGTKSRVLTLGFSAMRFLTVDELKSILAHEYAHFSHKDTFYSRFISRVDVSIHTALGGMGAAGGTLNYINPFYWFLVLYYRAYSLLSAGFSRSREYLADRMAVSLYGSDVFARALTKMSTDVPLFETTLFPAVVNSLNEQRILENMYVAPPSAEANESLAEHRENIQKELAQTSSSLFASHPAYRERIAACDGWPAAGGADETPAIQLFDNPEAIERELTELLTRAIVDAHTSAEGDEEE